MTRKGIARSARSKAAPPAGDPLIGLFREHSTRVRAQVRAARPQGSKGESFSGTLAQWITLHLTVTAHRLAQAAGEKGLPLEVLQKLTACIVALRKGDQAEEWLDLESRRVELAEQKTTEQMEAQFDDWLDDPEVMERFRPKPKLSEEEKKRRILDVFGITDYPPKPSPQPATVKPGPSPLEGAAQPALSLSNGSAPKLPGKVEEKGEDENGITESRNRDGNTPIPSVLPSKIQPPSAHAGGASPANGATP